MKKVKKAVLSVLLAAVLTASAAGAVFADDAAASNTPAEETAEKVISALDDTSGILLIDGYERIGITSSAASMEIDSRIFFDFSINTACHIAFNADEPKVFSLFTAMKEPDAMSKFSFVLGGEEETKLTVNVYGTDDSLLVDWTPIMVEYEYQDGVFCVFKNLDEPKDYTFYRYDIVVDEGEYFDLAEVAMYREAKGDIEAIIAEAMAEVEKPAAEKPADTEKTANTNNMPAMAAIPQFGFFHSIPSVFTDRGAK